MQLLTALTSRLTDDTFRQQLMEATTVEQVFGLLAQTAEPESPGTVSSSTTVVNSSTPAA